MPCGDRLHCLLPESTPKSTIHTCRRCGLYLHGICGHEDPAGDTEVQRICTRCHDVVCGTRKAQTEPDDAPGAKRKDGSEKLVDFTSMEVDTSAAGPPGGSATQLKPTNP